QILSLPMYPGLSSSQIKEVVAAIAHAVSTSYKADNLLVA
ncbi:MAG: erythromycin biosynthesis sensory transduction protein eryC1, partial [Nostoc sp.]